MLGCPLRVVKVCVKQNFFSGLLYWWNRNVADPLIPDFLTLSPLAGGCGPSGPKPLGIRTDSSLHRASLTRPLTPSDTDHPSSPYITLLLSFSHQTVLYCTSQYPSLLWPRTIQVKLFALLDQSGQSSPALKSFTLVLLVLFVVLHLQTRVNSLYVWTYWAIKAILILIMEAEQPKISKLTCGWKHNAFPCSVSPQVFNNAPQTPRPT